MHDEMLTIMNKLLPLLALFFFSCTTYQTVQYKAVFIGYDSEGKPIFKRVSENEKLNLKLKDSVNIITKVKV
jgi:hypothetical protein